MSSVEVYCARLATCDSGQDCGHTGHREVWVTTTHQRSDLHPATRGFYIIHLVSSGDKDQVADITRPARQPTLTISPNYLSAGPGPATATATAAADSHNKIIN